MTPQFKSEFDGKDILITGGTGSFGQKFVEVLLKTCEPNRVIIFSRDEFKQYTMQQIFSRDEYPCLRYFIGDVRSLDRLRIAFRGIDVIVHAAAMKQVPAAEYNPFECIHTNVVGAENIVTAAIENNVNKVIALSTDKAANPVNLYGASKLASDKIMIAANVLSAGTTKFSVVRYGNVLGSRGSVIPFFRKLVEERADYIPITDPRMTRFFISLQQGVEFVMDSLVRMRGGEVMVPKIPSIKITDLASALAPGVEHKFVGIRPGEKIHETMVPADDSRSTLEEPGYYVMLPTFFEFDGGWYREQGCEPVPENFCYSSDNNTNWLNQRQIVELLDKLNI